MATELNIAPRYAQWAVQGLARLLATFAILQGGWIVLGGSARWSGASYAVAMLVPGAPATWGVTLALAGVAALALTFTHHLRPVAVALFVIALWCGCFTAAIVAAALRNPLASAGFAFPVLLIVGLVLAAIYWHSGELRQGLAERVRADVGRDEAA